MNKKTILTILTALLITPIVSYSANAEVKTPTLAILDTGLDTSVQSIKDKLVYEVCILEWASCANGKTFMEGPGASSLPANILSKNGFDHGTLMASVAIKSNPNMNIVFVRVIGNTPTAGRQLVNETALSKAFEWVNSNRQKFNIQAISFSQGKRDNLLKAVDYCPKSLKMRSVISSLLLSGVPTFAATGNNRDYSRIDWPSCIPDTISIGATDENNEIAIYSNTDQNLMDFVSIGVLDNVIGVNNTQSRIAGTSVSTQVAAAQWINLKQSKPNLSNSELYSLLVKTSSPAKGPSSVVGKQINLVGAING
jgi:hypothetical protein